MATGNGGSYGPDIMLLLFQHQGESLQMTEELIPAAAGDHGLLGFQIIEALFQHQGENPPVFEELIKAAAGNKIY